MFHRSRSAPPAGGPGATGVLRRSAIAPALAVLGGVALALGAAGPAQANLVGGGTDPAGDAASGGPGRDLREIAISYDPRRGGLIGGIRLAAAPSVTEDAQLTLVAGHTTPTGCNGYPAVGLMTNTYRAASQWVLLAQASGGGSIGAAEKQGLATPAARLDASDGRLKGQRPDCVVAALTALDDPSVVYDTAGPFPLEPQPVLSLRLRDVPKSLAANRTRRVRVTVTNDGSATMPRSRVKVTGARGLKATPSSASVPSLRPGARRTVSLRVALSSRARSTTRLKVTGTAGAQQVSAEGNIRLRRPSGSSGGGGGTPDPPRLCTRWIPDFTGESGGSLGLVPC